MGYVHDKVLICYLVRSVKVSRILLVFLIIAALNKNPNLSCLKVHFPSIRQYHLPLEKKYVTYYTFGFSGETKNIVEPPSPFCPGDFLMCYSVAILK